MLKKILQKIIASLARKVILKYQPKVVAITGSVGKTSAKEAAVLACVGLDGVRAAKKNFNNEFGVPLAILGIENYPGRNFFHWLDVFIHAIGLLLYHSKMYPKILILEYGADKPGDILYLCEVARPEVAVITAIGTAHREFYKATEDILKEKISIFKYLKKGGTAIVNGDNEKLGRVLAEGQADEKISYGVSDRTNVRFAPLKIFDEATEDTEIVSSDKNPDGLVGKIIVGEAVVPINFKNLYGQHQVLGPLAGLSIALALGQDKLSAIQGIANYDLPAGRGRKLVGIKESILIDDTYNASPEAVLAGFESMVAIRNDRPLVLILGDMLELGEEAVSAHQKIGQEVARLKPALFVAVGEYINYTVLSAIEAGFNKENIFAFGESVSAGEFIKDKMPVNSLVYLKGSQGVRIEKITKMLLAEPARDAHLLCRQGDMWVNK